MFRDQKEELHRLEEELLRKDGQEDEEVLQEDEEDLLDDPCDYGEESEETYYNYSNRYGACQAYNSDRTDGDLEEYSRRVYEGKESRISRGLCAIAACLLVGIVVVFGLCVLKFKGII